MRALLLTAALLGAAVQAHATTIVLDFEEETPAVYTPSLASTECGGCVVFSEGTGEGVEVRDFGNQSDGIGLGAFGDDSSTGLFLDFLEPVTALSLDFGNDDPNFTDVGDEAVLQAFSGATLLGEARVVLNRNDVMDQSISIGGLGTFDRATFRYTNSIDEVVDNVTFETVPEPSALALLAFLAAAGRGRGRADSRQRPCAGCAPLRARHCSGVKVRTANA